MNATTLTMVHAALNIERMKDELYSAIIKKRNELNLTQSKVAEILGISQPRASNLLNQNGSFSLESLIIYFELLGGNASITLLES